MYRNLRLSAVCACVYNRTSNAGEPVLRKGSEFCVDVIVRRHSCRSCMFSVIIVSVSSGHVE